MKSAQINEEKMSNDEKDDVIIPTMSNTDSLISDRVVTYPDRKILVE